MTEIQTIVGEYYKTLYANKLGDLEEMDKFLKTYNPPKLNHKEIENLNVLTTSNKIELIIKKLPQNKSRTRCLQQVNSTKYLNKS